MFKFLARTLRIIGLLSLFIYCFILSIHFIYSLKKPVVAYRGSSHVQSWSPILLPLSSAEGYTPTRWELGA